MSEENQRRQTISRRSALKGLGAATGSLSVGVRGVGLASAKDGAYYQGDSVFVETKIEYRGVESDISSVGTGLLSYVVDARNGRVALNGGSPDIASNDLVLTNGTAFADGKTPLPAQTTDLSLNSSTDYRRQSRRTVPLEKPVTVPAITASLSGETVIVRIQGTSVTVPSGEQTSVELEPVEAEVEKTQTVESKDGDTVERVVTETQTVTPTLSIRNRGRVSLFAGRDVRLLPMNVDDSYARSRVKSHLDVAPERVVEETERDLLVVEDSSEMTQDKKQKLAEIDGGDR